MVIIIIIIVSLICAAKDQALRTKYYSSTILEGSKSPMYRVCGSTFETIHHIVAGCLVWIQKMCWQVFSLESLS